MGAITGISEATGATEDGIAAGMAVGCSSVVGAITGMPVGASVPTITGVAVPTGASEYVGIAAGIVVGCSSGVGAITGISVAVDAGAGVESPGQIEIVAATGKGVPVGRQDARSEGEKGGG